MFQALVCNDYDLEKLPFTIKLVTGPLHFVLEKMVLGMNSGCRNHKQTGATYKDNDQDGWATRKRTWTAARTEDITGLKNSGFKRHSIYLLEGFKEGELLMEDGTYKNVGQGDHLVGMLWVISAQLGSWIIRPSSSQSHVIFLGHVPWRGF